MKWVLGAAGTLLLALGLAVVLAVDSRPLVEPRDDVSPADVDRAVAMAQRHDPRRSLPGQLHSVQLAERDLDLLARYAARRFLAASARVSARAGALRIEASVPAPRGSWFNVELELQDAGRLPQVTGLRVGRLPLPASIALPMVRLVAERRGLPADRLLDGKLVERVSIADGRVTVDYRIGDDVANRLRSAFVAPADQERLRIYNGRLAELTRRMPDDQVSLGKMLPPLFALAAERSVAGGDASAENRAALLVLTLFANQRSLALLVPAAQHWPQPRPVSLTLDRRQDFPLHFLISTVIAAEAGTPLADAVGVWKEVADARAGGSGFSFNDLAADRAGTRFGEVAVRQPTRLQARLADIATEADFMPSVDGLPEFLPEAEFVARYGGVGGPAYNRVLADIEKRVDALPVLR